MWISIYSNFRSLFVCVFGHLSISENFINRLNARPISFHAIQQWKYIANTGLYAHYLFNSLDSDRSGIVSFEVSRFTWLCSYRLLKLLFQLGLATWMLDVFICKKNAKNEKSQVDGDGFGVHVQNTFRKSFVITASIWSVQAVSYLLHTNHWLITQLIAFDL